MLRYVLVLIVLSVGVPLVMISLGANQDAESDVTAYDEDAFVEQQAPYSASRTM